jgi:hypothetical protein
VRAADGSTARDTEHALPVDRCAEVVQGAHDAFAADRPRLAHSPEFAQQLVVGLVDEEAEHVHLRARDVAREFDSGDEHHLGVVGGGLASLREAVEGVVIGQREHAHAAPRREVHQLGGVTGAVRP